MRNKHIKKYIFINRKGEEREIERERVRETVIDKYACKWNYSRWQAEHGYVTVEKLLATRDLAESRVGKRWQQSKKERDRKRSSRTS